MWQKHKRQGENCGRSAFSNKVSDCRVTPAARPPTVGCPSPSTIRHIDGGRPFRGRRASTHASIKAGNKGSPRDPVMPSVLYRREPKPEVGMSLAVAIQMDPIETINIDADSTFALALEAQQRGHGLFHYLPDALTLRDGRLYARGRRLEVARRHGNHHRFGAFEDLALAGFDVILMRQDPPFDMAYITATHLLELLPEDGPLVVNDPAAVRNAPEKLFVLHFRELMPPTLLSLDSDEIRAFRQEHGEIALKQLFG